MLPLIAIVLVSLPWHPCQQAVAAPVSEAAAAPTDGPDCGHCPENERQAQPSHCVDVEKTSPEVRHSGSDVTSAPRIETLFVLAARTPAIVLTLPDDPAPRSSVRLHLLKSVLLI